MIGSTLDVHRALARAVIVDTIVYSYTLVAFAIHALTSLSCSRRRHDESSTHDAFALHDEPLLLAHLLHGVVALATFVSLHCGHSLECIRGIRVVALIAAMVDIAMITIHLRAVEAHDHSRELGLLYALVAFTLMGSALNIVMRATRIVVALDPLSYAKSPPPPPARTQSPA